MIHDLLDFHTTFHEETVDGAGDVWHGKYVQLLCNVISYILFYIIYIYTHTYVDCILKIVYKAIVSNISSTVPHDVMQVVIKTPTKVRISGVKPPIVVGPSGRVVQTKPPVSFVLRYVTYDPNGMKIGASTLGFLGMKKTQ